MKWTILAVVAGSAFIVALVGWVAVTAGGPTPTPEPGVQVDPDSPSGKEYALPLEDARRRASASERGSTDSGTSPTTAGSEQDAGSAPLFGEGIAARSSRLPARGGGQDGREDPTQDGPHRSGPSTRRRSGEQRESPPSAVLEAAGRPGAPAGGVGTTAVLAGGAALFLAIGAATGVLLRRRSRS